MHTSPNGRAEARPYLLAFTYHPCYTKATKLNDNMVHTLNSWENNRGYDSMVAARRPTVPMPPSRQADPIIHGSREIAHWLTHYWQKLQLPAQELSRLAITQDR